jgi:hypothetical protein
MKKHPLSWLSLTLMVIAAIAFALKLASLDSVSTHGGSVSGGDGEVVAEVGGSDIAGETEGQTHESRDTVPMTAPSSEARRMQEVFAYSLPLVEAFEQMAVEGVWSYDDQVLNVGMWQFLCEAGDYQLSAFQGESRDAGELRENVATLCHGFDAKRQEIEDFVEVEAEERMAGVNRRAALENSLDALGADGATIVAVAELSRALDAMDYAGVVGVAWFLGHYHFDWQSADLTVYSHPPNVETIFAVSSSIFCGSIGGCSGSHPITINLCMMFPWLPCSRRPADVHDAIDQILTGTQLDTYNEMNSALVRLLNRYRAGHL